jgi:hypothetical protein
VLQQLECLPCGVGEGGRRAVVVFDADEIEQDADGTLQLERGLPQEPQQLLVIRAAWRVLEEEVDEAEDAEERIGDVMRDVGGELPERGRAGEGSELALDRDPLAVRERS